MRRIGCVTAGFENRMGHVQVKDAGAENDLWLTANQKMKTSLYNCKEMNSYSYWSDLGSRFFSPETPGKSLALLATWFYSCEKLSRDSGKISLASDL